MKLKPLIKTHWLASQNPMSVSIVGLRRVVFCPPESVLNSEFRSDPDKLIELPPLSKVETLHPDEDEVRDVKSRGHTLSRDLFWTLFSGHHLPSLRTPPALLRMLAQSIEFHFEDGQCLSLIGIFRREGFPAFLDPRFYLLDRSCAWSRVSEGAATEMMKPLKVLTHQRTNDDFQKAWLVILEILAWALQRQRQLGDLEVLWSPDPADNPVHSRPSFPLQDIEFLKPFPLAATVMAEPETSSSSRITVWQGLDGNIPSGILRLHAMGLQEGLMGPKHEVLEVSERELGALADYSKIHSTPLKWQPLMATTDSGGSDIALAIARLEKIISKDHVIFIDHKVITGNDFKPHLKVRETEGSVQMSIGFSIESMGLRHLNFPTSLRPALAPLSGGLDYFFARDRKEIAARHAQFRANDLLFLRHQGMAIFCLLEMINWQLKRPLSSGAVIEFIDDLDSPEADRIFEVFLNYLKSSIPGLLGRPGSLFEEMFSLGVRNLFLNFVERLFHYLISDRSMIFKNGKIGKIEKVQGQVFPILRFLILHFVEASQGKLLTRAQAPLGDRFKEVLPQLTEPRVGAEDLELLWIDIGLNNKYLISLLFELVDAGIDVEFNGAPFLSHENPFEFTFSVGNGELKEDANWFDLHPRIFFNGTPVPTEEVKLNFTEQVGFIQFRGQIYRIDKKQIPTLKSLQRFWNRIKGQRQVLKHNSFGDKIYRLEKSQALELLLLKSQGIAIEAKGEWKRIFDYFEGGLGVEKIDVPSSMQGILLPHQYDGAQWLHDLYELKLGAILADEMGLGKTFQILAFLSSLQSRNELGRCLIVVPTSLVYNWLDEKKKFAPDLPVHIFQSKEQIDIENAFGKNEPTIVITTYGLINENLDFFEAHRWNVVVFDEAQNLKNITSLRSVSARKIKAAFKVCLTGTPMENNYLEFFSLCDLVVPGCLGDVDTFRKLYYNGEVRAESLKELRLISKPLLMRRTKSQVKLSLPVKTLQKVLLPFGEKQREIYKKMAMTFSRQVEELIQDQGERKAQIAMFAALMRLRQICSDPSAVPGVVYDEQPVKVEHFLRSLQDHLENDESVIVFTQFLSTLGRIENELKKLKVPTFTLQGKVSAKERLRLISAFQESAEPGVMLMTLKTGGVGLNLTKASVVYHLEPWWNPAVENQATDRAHRMGQKKDVKVYNLLIEGSLEERIADLKIKKQGSFDRLFNVEEQPDDVNFEGSSGLSRQDFIYLLK